jgi:uncharacterized Rmd1/YagE family protein
MLFSTKSQGQNSEKGVVVPLKAYYISRNIDVIRVNSNLYTSHHKEFCRNSMTVTINKDLNQYISVFTYGACVFFNIPTAEHLQHLRRIKEAAVISPIAEDRHFVEDYKVIVNENLDKPSVVRSCVFLICKLECVLHIINTFIVFVVLYVSRNSIVLFKWTY